MGYLTRQPTSNDPPILREDKSPWLGDDKLADETVLLLNGIARRCVICKRATRIRYLDYNQRCPDCR